MKIPSIFLSHSYICSFKSCPILQAQGQWIQKTVMLPQYWSLILNPMCPGWYPGSWILIDNLDPDHSSQSVILVPDRAAVIYLFSPQPKPPSTNSPRLARCVFPDTFISTDRSLKDRPQFPRFGCLSECLDRATGGPRAPKKTSKELPGSFSSDVKKYDRWGGRHQKENISQSKKLLSQDWGAWPGESSL